MINLNEDGKILKIVDSKKKEICNSKCDTFSQIMTNYLSVGMDARVAYGNFGSLRFRFKDSN